MKNTPIRAITVAMASAALVMGGAVIAGPSASAASRVSVNDCGDLAKKPADLVLACADANTMLTEMKWTGWSNKRAVGKGVYEANDCEPTCVEGTFRSYPARITLTAPKTQSGARVFTKATIAFTKAKPGKAKKITVRLAKYVPTPIVTPAPEETQNPVAPAPTATAAPTAEPTPTPTATATPTPNATATATATPTPTATQEAVKAPIVEVDSLRKLSTGKLRVSLTAEVPGVGGEKRGIRSVTVYRPNEYNAELKYTATFVGEDTAGKNEWHALMNCDASGKMKDTLRIVAVADNGETTTIRANQTRGGC